MRKFILSATLNTRDLGGYPLGRSDVTRFRRLIRSETPLRVSEKDRGLLLQSGITTIVDLRNHAEIAKFPCPLQEDSRFFYHHRKMAGDGRVPHTPQEVPVSYLEMTGDHTAMRGVMTALADAPDGALFHCTAGKDRTGVVAALLLRLAGVPLADILADYQISRAYLLPLTRALLEANPQFSPEVVDPKVEYMEAFMLSFLARYGSVRAYLSAIGLTGEQISCLRSRLR